MTMTDALAQASTEHVVYFLLTAYVEALHHCERMRLMTRPELMRLPVRGLIDVSARLRLLRKSLDDSEGRAPSARRPVEEAYGIFAAAVRRLEALARPSRGAAADVRWSRCPALDLPLTSGAETSAERLASARAIARCAPGLMLLPEDFEMDDDCGETQWK